MVPLRECGEGLPYGLNRVLKVLFLREGIFDAISCVVEHLLFDLKVIQQSFIEQ
jgi:hypothetical protein